MNTLAKYSGTYAFIKRRLKIESGRLTDLRAKYLEAKVDINERLPQKFIVERAYVPEKKYTPIRWLIVLVSFISSLLMGMLVVIAIENYNNLRKMKPA